MYAPMTEHRVGHDAPVRLIQPGPDHWTVSADTEMGLCLWRAGEVVAKRDLRSADPRRRPLDRIRAAAFSADGHVLFLAAGARLLATDTLSGEEIWEYRAPEFIPFLLASPLDVMIDPEGHLFVPFDNGTFERMTVNGKRIYRKRDNDSPNWVEAVGAESIVGCDNFHVSRWRLKDGKKIARSRPFDHAYAFAYSDVAGVAAVRDAAEVFVFELDSPESARRLAVRPGPPLVAVSPARADLAYADGMEAVVLSLIGNGEWRCSHGDVPLVSLAFDSRGVLMTGHADGSVKTWER